jgi:hypothetical protein
VVEDVQRTEVILNDAINAIRSKHAKDSEQTRVNFKPWEWLTVWPHILCLSPKMLLFLDWAHGYGTQIVAGETLAAKIFAGS